MSSERVVASDLGDRLAAASGALRLIRYRGVSPQVPSTTYFGIGDDGSFNYSRQQ
jgi:hypothetical protein